MTQRTFGETKSLVVYDPRLKDRGQALGQESWPPDSVLTSWLSVFLKKDCRIMDSEALAPVSLGWATQSGFSKEIGLCEGLRFELRMYADVDGVIRGQLFDYSSSNHIF